MYISQMQQLEFGDRIMHKYVEDKNGGALVATVVDVISRPRLTVKAISEQGLLVTLTIENKDYWMPLRG